MSVVLDSWAVLRLLEDDGPAARTVEELLGRERPVISWINLGEVFYVLRRFHGDEAATATIRDVRHAVEARLPDERLVLEAARIKSDVSMSYADAFAAAQAVALDAELWTGDPELLLEASAWRWKDLRTT